MPSCTFRPRPATLAALAALWGAAACQSAATPAGRAPAPSRVEPTAAELRADLFAFAADSFRGRETGTPDADRAAAWIARRLESLGLEPAGDSGYFQRVPMQRSRITAQEIAVATPSAKTALALGADVAFLTTLGPGAPLPKLSADADVVFASYGLVDPTISRDDYAGLDVAGKVVVIAGAAPPGLDSAQTARIGNPQALFNRLGNAIGRQPAAVLLLLPDSIFRLAAGQFAGTQIELGGAAKEEKPRALPMVGIARLTSGSLLLPAGWPAADKGGPLPGTKFTASISAQSQSFNGYNVAGIVRGSDPVLRNTYVAYGAHYDHIGIQPAVNGDSIANGADDDGSGSVTLLAIARSFVQGPKPKRSALFLWHVGEEKGLFGSQVFTDHPTVPLDSIVAQLNADMIGRNGDDSLYIVGPGAAPNGQSSVLGAVVDSVNAAGDRPFTFDREWDTTTHPERIYYRSDHFNYARKGIPIVFFTTPAPAVPQGDGRTGADQLRQDGADWRADVPLRDGVRRPADASETDQRAIASCRREGAGASLAETLDATRVRPPGRPVIAAPSAIRSASTGVAACIDGRHGPAPLRSTATRRARCSGLARNAM